VNRENGPAAWLCLGILDALEESFHGDTPEPSRVLIHDRNRGVRAAVMGKSRVLGPRPVARARHGLLAGHLRASMTTRLLPPKESSMKARGDRTVHKIIIECWEK
jgi:hypothetical protein